jgi:hypothetical protein
VIIACSFEYHSKLWQEFRIDEDFDSASGGRLPSDEACVRASAPSDERSRRRKRPAPSTRKLKPLEQAMVTSNRVEKGIPAFPLESAAAMKADRGGYRSASVVPTIINSNGIDGDAAGADAVWCGRYAA